MRSLSECHTEILNSIWSNCRAASALNRLCDQLSPIFLEVMAGDFRTVSQDYPSLSEDPVADPTTEEIVVVIAVAWIDALFMSDFRRGPTYLSDLDDDFLPKHADLDEMYAIGRYLGLDENGVRAIFRKMKEHQPHPLRLPRELLRVLKALDFFAKNGDELAIPDDLVDALDVNDCAFVWAYGEGYVLQQLDDSQCHIERLSRAKVLVDSEVRSADSGEMRIRGWARERVSSFALDSHAPSETRQSALDGFRKFLSHRHLGYVKPREIGNATA